MEYAIEFKGRRRVERVVAERPEYPEPGHVLGRTLYTLISPGTELMSGYMDELETPRRPGYASVFKVERVSAETAGIAPGDLAFCMGNHQSYQHMPTDKIVKLPDGLAAETAVLARLMNVSMTTLMTTAAKPGDPVLIMGAGPVGFLAAHLFKRCGYKVMICDPDERRLRLARQSGIPFTAKRPPLDDPEWYDQVSLVLECSGHEAAVLDGCRFVRPKGEVVLIGVPWKRRTDDYAHELLSLVFHRYVVLRSGWEWEIPPHSAPFQPQSIYTNLRKGLDWLSEGLLNTEGLIRKVDPRDADRVYADLAASRLEELFILFDWQAARSGGED